MPVTLAHAAQTYVVLTNVQSACTPTYGILTHLLHGWRTLRTVQLEWNYRNICLPGAVPYRCKKNQHSLTYILLTPVTLPPRQRQTLSMHIAGRQSRQSVLNTDSYEGILTGSEGETKIHTWSEYQTVKIIAKTKGRVMKTSSVCTAVVACERRFVPCSSAHFSSQCRCHAALTILQMAKTHTHNPKEDSDRPRAAPGLYGQNLCASSSSRAMRFYSKTLIT